MIFPYKAVLFDWAYTLVDLVQEDDRAAFIKMTEFLREKKIELPDFELLFGAYQELFYGLINESRQTHREACFETVLRHLFFKYKIEIENRTSWQDILTVYYEIIHSVRIIYPDVVETLRLLRKGRVRMGIISNTTNPKFIKDKELHQTELGQYFEFALSYSQNIFPPLEKYIINFRGLFCFYFLTIYFLFDKFIYYYKPIFSWNICYCCAVTTGVVYELGIYIRITTSYHFLILGDCVSLKKSFFIDH